jgi:hypothetical protein
MLHSGKRQKAEADTSIQGQAAFKTGADSIVQGAMAKKRALELAPVLTKLGYNAAVQRQQSDAQQISDQTAQQRQQLMGAGFGLIGTGIGTYYGQRNTNPDYSTRQTGGGGGGVPIRYNASPY